MSIDPEKLTTLYWYCAIIGTVIFVFKTALSADTGSEVSTDFNSMVDTDTSFHIFTIESVSAFSMCFGWVGWYAISQLALELKLTICAAVITGVIGMIFFAWLITKWRSLESIPKYDLNQLIGRSGRAYMNFAPKGSSKIEIELNSKLTIIDAINDSDNEIKSFEQIKVVKVENDCVYIVKGE